MSQQTFINGNRYSFTSISVQLNGVDVAKGAFRSLNYDAQQDPGMVQGNQVAPVGRTTGYGQGTGSFEILVYEFDQLASSLTANGVVPIMSVDFDIVVSYSVNNVDVRTDTLRGVRITKIGSANQQGSDATTKSCDLSIMRLWLNGIPVYADPAT